MNSEYYYNGIQGIPILPDEAEYRDQIFKLRDQQYKASEAAEQEAREALYEPGVSPYVVEQDLSDLIELGRQIVECRWEEKDRTNTIEKLKYALESEQLRATRVQPVETLDSLLAGEPHGDKIASIRSKIAELDREARGFVTRRLELETARDKLHAKIEKEGHRTMRTMLENLAGTLEMADEQARRAIEFAASLKDAGVSLDAKLFAPSFFVQFGFREGSSDGLPGKRFVDANSQSQYHAWRNAMIESGVISS